MRRTFGRASARHCEASTSRTWLVPMPNAIAPNAPWVEVWLSPQAIVMPGWVSPSSGPITCTIPWSPEPIGKKRIPCFAVFASIACSISSACASRSGRARRSVGTMWSTVAKVRSGTSTGRPGVVAASGSPAGS